MRPSRPAPRRTAAGRVLTGALLVAATVGCRSHTVELTFRPEVGTVYHYEVVVHSVTETSLAGAEPERKDETVDLVAVHRVVGRSGRGATVQVEVGPAGLVPQSFVVRFDRRGGVRSVQPSASDARASLGLAEIFPAVASGTPRRGLTPGGSWTIDERVRVPGSSGPARLRGEGRLVRLARDGGRSVASLRTSADLPSLTSSTTAEGTLVLDGEQHLSQRSTYDLGDGALLEATTVTEADFAVTVLPPGSTGADGVPGTSKVRITSTTRRVATD